MQCRPLRIFSFRLHVVTQTSLSEPELLEPPVAPVLKTIATSPHANHSLRR